MSAIEKLQEMKRDIVVDYCLQYVLKGADGDALKIKNRDELSKFFLCNIDVAGKVNTSKGAHALFALQLMLQGIFNGSEPGYKGFTKSTIQHWDENLSDYGVWGALRKIKNNPDLYLDPTLRNDQTAPFNALASTLSQGPLDKEGLGAAISTFMTSFEKVANLHPVCAYVSIDGAYKRIDFIGKDEGPSGNIYQRSLKFRHDEKPLSPWITHWSDWGLINVPLPKAVLDHTIRIVYCGNREYVSWLVKNEIHSFPEASAAPVIKYEYKFFVCYKSIDGSWTVPLELWNKNYTKDEMAKIDEKKIYTVFFENTVNAYKDMVAVISIDTEYGLIFDARLKKKDIDKNDATAVASWYKSAVKAFSDNNKNIKEEDFSIALSGEKIKQEGNVPGFSLSTDSVALAEGVSVKFSTSFEKKTGLIGMVEGGILQWGLLKLKLSPHVGVREDALIGPVELEIKFSEAYKAKNFSSKFTFSYYRYDGINSYEPKEFDIATIAILNKEYPTATITLRQGDQEHVINITFGTEAGSKDDAILSNPVVIHGEAPAGGSILLRPVYLQFRGDASRRIRLNTTFAKDMSEQIGMGFDEFFAIETQLEFEEPSFDQSESKQAGIDFSGANARYLWELYFHIPVYIAWKFNSLGMYAEARQWLHYIFQPFGRETSWHFLPFRADDSKEANESSIGVAADTTDPFELARDRMSIFKAYISRFYIDTYINEADANYDLLLPDYINKAYGLYNHTLELLGECPELTYKASKEVVSLKQGATEYNEVNVQLELDISNNLIPVEVSSPPHLPTEHSDYFSKPFDSLKILPWTRVNSALKNMSRGLGRNGIPLPPALFSPIRDPHELLVSRASGGNAFLDQAISLLAPTFRYRILAAQAHTMVDYLISAGSEILLMRERGEGRRLEEMQLNMLTKVQQRTVDLQKNLLSSAQHAKDATRQALDFANRRKENSKEEQALLTQYSELIWDVTALKGVSTIAAGVAQGFWMAAAPAHAIPDNVFGFGRFADGLDTLGGSANALAAMTQVGADILQQLAEFKMRVHEFKLQLLQIDQDATVLEMQDLAQQGQVDAMLESVAQAELELANTTEQLKYMSTRFTNSQLYNWLSGRLSELYVRNVKAVVGMCHLVRKSFQYETGIYDADLLDLNIWSSQANGLTAGNVLKTNLIAMDAKYFSGNWNQLEIREVVYLKSYLHEDIWNKKVNSAFKKSDDGKTISGTGLIDFSFTSALFDKKFPGHYNRKIVSVGVGIASSESNREGLAVYTPILRQVASATLLEADQNLAAQLLRMKPDDQEKIIAAVRQGKLMYTSSNASIALTQPSIKWDGNVPPFDYGIFSHDRNAEMYAPFENTGAISSWVLDFSGMIADATPDQFWSADGDTQKCKITDIAIEIVYRAFDGGPEFREIVRSILDKVAHS